MTVFRVLLLKEFRWLWRSYRIAALVAIFLVLGLGSPLLLHFLPDLLESAGSDVVVTLPEFTAGDAIAEYLSNLVQMGVIGVILITMGAVAGKRSTGTAVFTLSRPVSFLHFVLAKYVALLILVAVATQRVLRGRSSTRRSFSATPPLGELVLSVLLTLLVLAVMVAITLVGSCISKSQILAGAGGLGAMILLGLFGVLPVLSDYSPYGLNEWAATVVRDDTADPVWIALGLSAVITVIAPYAGAKILASREL